ncbi:MAG: RNA polymerase sigma-54 factor, partial [Desulfuromonadaceae bacterium]|nr:RNA polymerase sigma-54 factor [Desulfuromonadaceae bacterium]
MALEIRQQLKLSQQLVMTPQLQQAIKLLQLSRMELMEMVRDELEKNPLLEEGPEESDEKESPREEQEIQEEAPEQKEFIDPAEGGDRFKEIDWQTYFGEYSFENFSGESSEGDEERPFYENVLAKKTSLADHLRWQISLSRIDDQERKVAFEIIGNIDEDGYLMSTVEEIAEVTSSPPSKVEEVLLMVQELDPPGVASRDLQECLLSQIKALQIGNPLVENIIRFHLKEMESRKYNVIAKALDVPLEEVLAAAKIVSSLEPRPGRSYFEEDT